MRVFNCVLPLNLGDIRDYKTRPPSWYLLLMHFDKLFSDARGFDGGVWIGVYSGLCPLTAEYQR